MTSKCSNLKWNNGPQGPVARSMVSVNKRLIP